MTVRFSPIFNSQVVDSLGNPAVGWRIYSYLSGTSTPATTYTDSTGGIAQTNPIVINSLGFPTTGQIWLTEAQPYKLVLTDGSDVVKKTEDNVSGVNDQGSLTIDQFLLDDTSPTYISATQFSVTTDKSSTYHVGRRVKTQNTGGTIYSRVSAVAFASVTTVTIVNDSGTLDSGLSSVSVGILRADNSAVPYVKYPSAGNQTNSAALLFEQNVTLTTGKTLALDGVNLSGAVGGTISGVLANTGYPTFNGVNVGDLIIPAKGRLTLITDLPVTVSDITGITTLFFTPYKGNVVQLYDGTAWRPYTFSQLSQTAADTTKSPAAVANSSCYDIFVWNDAGTLRATRGPLWNSDTVRGAGAGTTELEIFQGREVNKVDITNGPLARRGLYVGTVRSNASAQFNDSVLLRHVWNRYNKVSKPVIVTDGTATWTYSPGVGPGQFTRQARASSANQIDIVCGISENAIVLDAISSGEHSSSGTNAVIGTGIGVDSTTVASGLRQIFAASTIGIPMSVSASYRGFPAIGRHFYAWLEYTSGNTATFYGTGGGAQPGLTGIWMT